MRLGISPLLVETPRIAAARKTLRAARSAFRSGNLRLAASRAITAAVQAGIAGYLSRAPETKLEAHNIIEEVRELLQGIVIRQAGVGLKKLG